MRRKAFFIFFTVFIVGLFFYTQKRIIVYNTVCEGCSRGTMSQVDAQKGATYFEAKRNLSVFFKDNSRIKSFYIRFVVPSTVSVRVEEKKEAVALKFADDRFFVFDKDSDLLGEVTSTNLPVIQVMQVPQRENMLNGIKLFMELLKYYSPSNSKLDKFGLHVSLPQAGEVIFPLEGDIDVILGSLEVVLSQLNRLSQNHTIVVDLRYKNPVVSSYE